MKGSSVDGWMGGGADASSAEQCTKVRGQWDWRLMVESRAMGVGRWR